MSSDIVKYVSVTEAARGARINPSRVRQLAIGGLIPGAYKLGARAWAIPATWEYQRGGSRSKVKRQPL